MDYTSQRNIDMTWAQSVADSLNNSTDKYVVYKESRPIADIKHMIESSVQLYGDNVAFMQKFSKEQPYKSITYKEAFAAINALGTALIENGLKGKRIAVIGENCYQWATSYLAVICGTGVVVPLDKELGASELEQLVKESEASAVMFTEKYTETFKNIKSSGETNLEMLIKLNGENKEDGVLTWSCFNAEG